MHREELASWMACILHHRNRTSDPTALLIITESIDLPLLTIRYGQYNSMRGVDTNREDATDALNGNATHLQESRSRNVIVEECWRIICSHSSQARL